MGKFLTMNNYEAEVLLRFLFCKLKFDLDLLIGLKNAMKFKDSMPWVRSAFGSTSCLKSSWTDSYLLW